MNLRVLCKCIHTHKGGCFLLVSYNNHSAAQSYDVWEEFGSDFYYILHRDRGTRGNNAYRRRKNVGTSDVGFPAFVTVLRTFNQSRILAKSNARTHTHTLTHALRPSLFRWMNGDLFCFHCATSN